MMGQTAYYLLGGYMGLHSTAPEARGSLLGWFPYW